MKKFKKLIIIIQARFNSSRLPGKVLRKCAGKPLIQWTIDRLNNIDDNLRIVVATSKKSSDDEIYNYCRENKINCYRGSLDNVIQRMIDTCYHYQSEYFIRICGDSPIIDPVILKKAIKISENFEFDIITNTAKRTYPKGQSVELIKVSSLEKLTNEKLTNSEREHVTEGFYNRPSKYNIYNFESDEKDFSNLQLSVDTIDDFKKIEYLINLEIKMRIKNYYTWQEFANLSRYYCD